MRPQSTWPRKIATTLTCALLLAGCSSQTKDRLLRVFFTGVDATNRPPTTAEAPVAATNQALLAVAPSIRSEVHTHPPYFERKCTACHVNELSQELRSNGGDLCLGCHDKLIGNAKHVHAPVSDGRCDLCHLPHESPEPFLLTRKAQELCLDCHSLAQMEKLRGHATMGTSECVSCHDPHRSELPKLAKAKP